MLIRAGCVAALLLAATGCSTDRLVARGASPLIVHGVTAMNRESDLEFARASIPANLKMLEALLLADPGNTAYRVQAATGFNGYALGFVEADDPERARALYKRALDHALLALADAGIDRAILNGDPAKLSAALAKLPASAVPALFWAASSWAKWIELQLDDPERLAEFTRVEALMQRALALDETYYFGGPQLFFGVFYGARAPMFGGDFVRSKQHFDRAAQITGNQLLLIEVYRAKYLLRQMADRDAFHATLTAVLAAAPDNPELNLANAIAKRDAQRLLDIEEELF